MPYDHQPRSLNRADLIYFVLLSRAPLIPYAPLFIPIMGPREFVDDLLSRSLSRFSSFKRNGIKLGSACTVSAQSRIEPIYASRGHALFTTSSLASGAFYSRGQVCHNGYGTQFSLSIVTNRANKLPGNRRGF